MNERAADSFCSLSRISCLRGAIQRISAHSCSRDMQQFSIVWKHKRKWQLHMDWYSNQHWVDGGATTGNSNCYFFFVTIKIRTRKQICRQNSAKFLASSCSDLSGLRGIAEPICVRNSDRHGKFISQNLIENVYPMRRPNYESAFLLQTSSSLNKCVTSVMEL